MAKGAAASTVDEIAVVILTPLDGAVKPAAAEIAAANGNRVSFIGDPNPDAAMNPYPETEIVADLE